jgi:hypothetical protein
MKRRLPLYVLLVSALVFLASLFLPWRETTAQAPPFGSGVHGLLNLFAGGSVEGWVAIVGDVAVLLVVAVVLATVAALHRPQLVARLPIGGLGVALGYFAVAVAMEVHTLSGEFRGGFTGRPPTPHTSWAYGFYLGLASAGIATLSALASRRSELLRPRGAAEAAVLVFGVGLLISFLLPWVGSRGPGALSIHGIENPAAVIAALVLILGAGWLLGEAGRRWRLPLAIATAVLTGGAASATVPFYGHRYGAWIGVGCAVSLVALEAVRAWPVRLPVPPRGLVLLRMGAAALLIVGLFLPWQELHAQGVSGRGYDGWYSATGAAAGGLSLLLLASPALPALENHVLDAVVAVVIFVSAAGTAFREESSFFRVGYGAFIGFAAAGILLVTVLLPLRPGRVDRERALTRAVPLAASVLCVAAVVVPLWFLLPQNWTFQSFPLTLSLAVPGVLLTLYLVRLWASRVRGPAKTGHRLTLVPLVLLTLAALELIRFRNGEVIWGAVILVGLCLLLAVYGWIEENRGLQDFRVPEEIWRVDRLPEAES